MAVHFPGALAPRIGIARPNTNTNTDGATFPPAVQLALQWSIQVIERNAR